MCTAAALPSGCLPGFGSGEVLLQLVPLVKLPPQAKLYFIGLERRARVLQVMLNLGKVTQQPHSWPRGQAWSSPLPAAREPWDRWQWSHSPSAGEGRGSSPAPCTSHQLAQPTGLSCLRAGSKCCCIRLWRKHHLAKLLSTPFLPGCPSTIS